MAKRLPQGDPQRAVADLRVSTDEQRHGPEVQRAELHLGAAREGIAIVSWHEDLGVSGGDDLDRQRSAPALPREA